MRPPKQFNPVLEKMRKERMAKRPGSNRPENCRVHKLDVSNPYRLKESVDDRFISQTTDNEALLKSETVGLVDLAEFQKIKDEIDAGNRTDSTKKKFKGSSSSGTKNASSSSGDKLKKRLDPSVLSFDPIEDEDSSYSAASNSLTSSLPNSCIKESKKEPKKVTKNPFVDTSYLPDRDKEGASAVERERLKAELLKQQELIKSEEAKVPFMFWDGSGHPFVITIKKGDSIESFLTKAKAMVPGLRSTLLERLLLVKDDLIIQHHYSFYDLMLNKIRGKNRPIFEFHGDEAVASIHERPLVVESAWYEGNKKLLPASKWEPFNASRHFVK